MNYATCIGHGCSNSQQLKMPTQQQTGIKVEEESRQYSGEKVSISLESRVLSYSSDGANFSPIATAKTSDVESVSAEPQERNAYSQTILSAIESQLKRDLADGATAEELQSRLQAGFSGFSEGFNDALSQLSGMPGFGEDILAQVNETKSQVLHGLNQLAESMGLESVVPESEMAAIKSVVQEAITPEVEPVNAATPATRESLGQQILSKARHDLQLIESIQKEPRFEGYSGRTSKAASQYGYQVSEQRRFDFNMVTRDGDVVTIKLEENQMGAAHYGRSADSHTLSQFGEQSSSFRFEVDGELDKDELNALNELLAQVGDISESFFNGDVEKAFQVAQTLDYDASEISTFDIHWNKSTHESSVVDEHSSGHRLPQNATPHYQGLFDQIHKASDLAQTLDQPRSLVADLTDWVAQQTHPRDPWAHHAGEFVRQFV